MGIEFSSNYRLSYRLSRHMTIFHSWRHWMSYTKLAAIASFVLNTIWGFPCIYTSFSSRLRRLSSHQPDIQSSSSFHNLLMGNVWCKLFQQSIFVRMYIIILFSLTCTSFLLSTMFTLGFQSVRFASSRSSVTSRKLLWNGSRRSLNYSIGRE